MNVHRTPIGQCYELQPTVFEDDRGRFVKPFQGSLFQSLNLREQFGEDFYSISKKGVLRGMHFQIPPRDQHKLVYCVFGRILDVVVDLRRGSPTYREHFSLELSAHQANLIYIPPGLAHGFYTQSDVAVVCYKVSSEYSPSHDFGIRWDSLGFDWPAPDPIVSERDGTFPPLRSFESPFRYE